MCTAVSLTTKDHYFGRNLDLEYSYGETVTITGRNFPLRFRCVPALSTHYALIGVAHVSEGCPLYYDAVNEKGLAMAGLNFPGNAVYREFEPQKKNIASFELIPWLLGSCANVREAGALLETLNLWNGAFSSSLPPTPLHWLLSDRNESLVLEPMADGLHIHSNPAGILTNNPPFEQQLFRLNDFMHLSRYNPDNRFSGRLSLCCYSRGMGALGLPGDLSSQSRFIRASFLALNSVCGDSEEESISRFFHILSGVEQQRGCVVVPENSKYEFTLYSSCCNTSRGIYYYTTYHNRRLNAVDMHRENLDSDRLVSYPLLYTQDIFHQN